VIEDNDWGKRESASTSNIESHFLISTSYKPTALPEWGVPKKKFGAFGGTRQPQRLANATRRLQGGLPSEKKKKLYTSPPTIE